MILQINKGLVYMTKKLYGFKNRRRVFPTLYERLGIEVRRSWGENNMHKTLCGVCGKVLMNRFLSGVHFLIQAFIPNANHSRDAERRHIHKSVFEDKD